MNSCVAVCDGRAGAGTVSLLAEAVLIKMDGGGGMAELMRAVMQRTVWPFLIRCEIATPENGLAALLPPLSQRKTTGPFFEPRSSTAQKTKTGLYCQ